MRYECAAMCAICWIWPSSSLRAACSLNHITASIPDRGEGHLPPPEYDSAHEDKTRTTVFCIFSTSNVQSQSQASESANSDFALFNNSHTFKQSLARGRPLFLPRDTTATNHPPTTRTCKNLLLYQPLHTFSTRTQWLLGPPNWQCSRPSSPLWEEK